MTDARPLRWRNDLQATFTGDAEGPCVHVEDPSNGKFFRIGADEYELLSRFDGQRSWSLVAREANGCLGTRSLNDEEVQRVVHWACQRQLLVPTGTEFESRFSNCMNRAANRPRFNLLSIRVPLGSPDRWCEKALPYVNWLFGGPALVVCLILLVLAAGETMAEWDRFVASSRSMFVPSSWLRLGLAWVILKILHEAGHALVCKRYGGEVREVGFAVLYFVPVAYVDVTSCWRFASRWPRIHTALAGMSIELLVAAVAVLISSQCGSPEVQHFFDNVALMASLTTVLFNLNPLARFDGYYVLTDLCGVTNLYSRGRQAAGQMLKRWLAGSLGLQPVALWLAAYGVATWLWNASVVVGVILAVSLYWHGLGLILATSIGLGWLGSLIRQAGGFVRQCNSTQRRVLAVRSAIVTGFTLCASCVTAWPFREAAPGVIEFSPLAVVRADSSGFVETVWVKDGQAVDAGQPLLVLRNEELERERQDLEIEILQSQLRERLAAEQHDPAAVQVEQNNRRALEQRLAERLRQTERLMLRAPIHGVVIGRQLPHLPGSYVAQGAEILSIGDPTRCEFIATVSQVDSPSLPQSAESTVVVDLHGRGQLLGRIRRIDPRASIIPEHLCLCAPYGGPLAIRSQVESPKPSSPSNAPLELLQPHVQVSIVVDGFRHSAPRAGELGWIRWEHSRTFADYFWHKIRSAYASFQITAAGESSS